MKIAGVDFREPLITALRDGQLVIFAGAGVSMGPPACLPGFAGLACQVAKKIGKNKEKSETEDQFLGRLKDTGADVHLCVAELLQQNNPKPTELHRNLLRFYNNRAENVRIVTTNFDLLFEQAASELLNPAPQEFEAPALPLGDRFRGIVHIHGSINDPQEMVLTHRDFGRAYLTEADGWARRFLVDLLTESAVLFVGYSHSDTIMTYLTPSLPRDDNNQRYALTGSKEGDSKRWAALGIKPIIFPQSNEHDYTALDEAVENLADHIQRGILDWQREITEIAKKPPPMDEESAGVITYALREPETTRFFTDAAKSPDWISWLDDRKYLDALFADGDLTKLDKLLAGWLAHSTELTKSLTDWLTRYTERNKILADWLACQFTDEHADSLFLAIGRHSSKPNADFWRSIAIQMYEKAQSSPDKETLARWVFFLTSTIPENEKGYSLLFMAKHCANRGVLSSLLQIYYAMTTSRHLIHARFPWREDSQAQLADLQLQFIGEGYTLREVWENCLEPNIKHIAESLLYITTRRLKERYYILQSWKKVSYEFDPDSLNRSTIESDESNDRYRSINTLITIARECLEWLALERMDTVRLWSERYVDSEAPLLRRLAIHTLSVRTDLSQQEKFDWLLERVKLHQTVARHEIARVVYDIYPAGTQEQRKKLIQIISDYRWPDTEDMDKESRTAYKHFQWLVRLTKADPDCSLAKQAIAAIQTEYPDFSIPEQPEQTQVFKVTSEIIRGKPSPWSVPEILDQPASEWLPQALNQQPREYPDHPRDELIDNVEEATRKDSAWSLELVRKMVKQEEWNTLIWKGIIRGWRTAEMDQNELEQAIEFLSSTELLEEYDEEIANALHEIITKNKTEPNKNTLILANNLARQLWDRISTNDNMSNYDWLMRAVNHPSGNLALFWIQSIMLWRKQYQTIPDSPNKKYRFELTSIMQDRTIRGKLGRTILVSQLHVMLAVDESWTLENLLPLFRIDHEDFKSAWDGFLTWGHLTPQVAECLQEAFIEAVQRINHELAGDKKERFTEYYAAMLGRFAKHAEDRWITELFSHSDNDIEVKHFFADVISRNLRNMNEIQQHECWQRWLRDYWKNRLQGFPAPLDSAEEIEIMINWTVFLSAVYPEAVDLAVQMPEFSFQLGTIMIDLSDSELPVKYPKEVVKLLNHLSNLIWTPSILFGAKEVIKKLNRDELDKEVKKTLDEIIARKGLDKGMS